METAQLMPFLQCLANMNTEVQITPAYEDFILVRALQIIFKLFCRSLKKLRHSSDRQYCIEVIRKGSDHGDAILVLKNDQIIDTIPGQNFVDIHLTCLNHFDFENDILQLRHSGGTDGVMIHVNLINKGETQKLLFGKNANLDWFFIDSYHANCHENVETTKEIQIKNGFIIKSECIGHLEKNYNIHGDRA